MSLNFSANQFEAEFKASRLRNWEIPKWHPQRPCGNKGKTRVVSNEKGHLLPGVPRSVTNPWGNFVGTWDLPNRISREEAFRLSAPTIDKIEKWRRHCIENGCPPPSVPKIFTVSKRGREATSAKPDVSFGKKTDSKAPADGGDTKPAKVEPEKVVEEAKVEEKPKWDCRALRAARAEEEKEKAEEEEEDLTPMAESRKPRCGSAQKPNYIPGQFTDPQYRHPSHDDLVKGIYEQHIQDNPPKGYPRYKDDFLGPIEEDCRCPKMSSPKMPSPKQEEIRKPKKKDSPYITTAKNFVFARKLHKENLEHKPLPDTIADAMYRKSQLLGGQPGLMLKDGNYATGVGWKGYPGFGATRCTKLKVYRPKTCGHAEPPTPKANRPCSVSSFDKKWRFIRQKKVTPMELAIRWDLTPMNRCDEPRPPKHIDGSNGSQAPAVFSLVHTPRENIVKITETDGCACKTIVEIKKERPRSAVWEEEHPICSRIERAKSAYNLCRNPEKGSSKSSGLSSNKHFHKSTPTITTTSCSNCRKRHELLPNARLCVACELKDSKPAEKPRSEFKAAFKAGVPNNNNKSSGKRQEYPDHWRLASVYQHSYKPLHLRKRSLLASVFL